MDKNKKDFLVSIIMGSDSDLPVVKGASKILDEFEVKYDIKIISAHRSPEGLTRYINNSQSSSVKVFIASAGLAAHLPGVIAAQTTLPVIGIPVIAKSSPDGLDSLFSIVQMPPGVPVASVGLNNAKNAGLLAVQMLALSDKNLSDKLQTYKQKMKQEVENKSMELEKIGIDKYLEKLKK